jgi:hypothetical protein
LLSKNQVTGALFDFAPAAGECLRTHLCGDIFERDNLDWQSRALAALGMLVLADRVDATAAQRVRSIHPAPGKGRVSLVGPKSQLKSPAGITRHWTSFSRCFWP